MSGLTSHNISATSIRVHGITRERDMCVFCRKRSSPPPNDPLAPVFAFFSLVDCRHYACQPCALVHCDNAGRHIRCPACCAISRLAQSGRRRGNRVDERVPIDDGVSSAASQSSKRVLAPPKRSLSVTDRRRRTSSVQFSTNLTSPSGQKEALSTGGSNTSLTLAAVGRLPTDPNYSKGKGDEGGTVAAFSEEERISVDLYTIKGTAAKRPRRTTAERARSQPLPPAEYRYLTPPTPFHRPPPLVIHTIEEEEEVAASFQLIVREIEQTIAATLVKEADERDTIGIAEAHRRNVLSKLREEYERKRFAAHHELNDEFSDAKLSPRTTTNASDGQVSETSDEGMSELSTQQDSIQKNYKQPIDQKAMITKERTGTPTAAEKQTKHQQQTITKQNTEEEKKEAKNENNNESKKKRRERVEVATWDSEQQLRLFEQLMDLARDEQQHRAKIQRDETRMHAEMERSEASDVATIKAAMEAMAESARREQEELLRDEKEERYTIQEDERRLRRNITRQSAELSLDVSMQHVQQRGKEDAQRELDMLRVALESTAVETTSRARLNLVVTEELRARDSLCSDEASERAMHAAEERRERVEVATWDSEQQLRLFEQLMDLARDEQQHRAKIQRDETRMHAEMERSEASDVATIKAAMEAMAESARREQEELLRDEKEERYTIQEDERRLRRNITRQSAELSLDVSMQHVQQRGKEDAQRELDMLRVALESTAVETTSRARLNLVVTEELRARDSLCSDEASERAMHAAEERRERVEVATWDSEQQLRLFEQLMDLARDEQQHRAKIQRDETRMHAEMERSEASDVATIKAAMEAMAESARREQEELLRDEKEERYTIQEDERRLRRNITRQSAELSLDVSMQHVQQRGKEDAQRELDMLRVALESTAVETTSRARLNLVVTEELRARDSLCSDEASERAMHAAEERRERVEVATWDSEQQLRLFEQLMDLARDEQQHRAKIQRDETRMHAEMERSEASDVATIKAAMEAMAESARREQEELLRDEKEERYTIQEDERRLRRNITRQSAELSLDVSMQHVQQRGKEDAQRELDMLRVALESTAVETTSRARLNLVVTEELRARDSLCSDEASERAMHAAEERRERVEVATWDSEQQLRLFEQLMDLARDEQQHRAKIQRDETRMHAEMERSEASDVATIKAAMEAMAESARREQEELLRDEKEERYTIQEDERRLRRNITRQSAELSLDVSMQHVQQRGKEDAQRELDMLRVALESTAVETTSRARLNLVVTEELRARDSLCSDEASERAMHAAEERRERVEVATWDSEQQLRLFEQLMDLARDEQQHRAKIQRDETRMHAEMERSEASDVATIKAAMEAMAESARRKQQYARRDREEIEADEKEERYTIQEDERRLRRNITRQSAELSLDVSMQHVQQRGKEDAQRELDMLRVALESTAVETTSRARLNLVVTEELRARDSLCSDEASERAMHAAEERRERVEVATWDSEQQLRLFEQLMDLARDEQQHRAKIQRDETRMHAEMERSEASDVATIKAAMEAMAESARRKQQYARRDREEIEADEKEERYTIQEDERRLRRNITRQTTELSLDVSMQHVQQRGKEDAQRELDMLRVALESTAVETTSRARLNLVVTEELRARDSLCSDEASERAMHAAEERRERVEVATWDSEQQLWLFEQLMDLARDEQQHRAKIQRDETRMHAEMERSEASDVATIKAAMEAMAESARRKQQYAMRDREESKADEKEERYTIQEDERRLRRNITRQSAELSLDVSMQHVQQRGKEDAQRELGMLRVALESTAVETTSRARLNLVVTEELRARDSLCSDEASERAMHAAEERRERVEVATWDSEQQLRLFEQLMDLARDEQQHRAKIQRDETRMHAEMERSEASDVATIKAAMEAMAESARRKQQYAMRDREEIEADEKEERYTIQEDERRLRRNITRQTTELSLDVSMQHVQQRGKEDAQRELDMLRVALESTAVETTSRARLNLVVTEELRARDSLCSDEASERAMHAAEERRERVEVATWDSEQQLRLFEQLMDLARDEQQHRAKIQRDETRMHAEMERSEASDVATIKAAMEAMAESARRKQQYAMR
ncbi:hypothetical protein, conserved, partial [Trypanosoma brucei gambiense DAL972]